MLKRNGLSTASLIVLGSSDTDYGGYFIRTRQLIRAFSVLNQSLNVIEFQFRHPSTRKKVVNFERDNVVYRTINCVSQAPFKGSFFLLMRQLVFQAESLKLLRLAKLLRKSQIVILTSCLQVLPALISKLLGTQLVFDMNDVNSRVALRIQDTVTRTIRYLFWRLLESFGCMLADIVLVNKEDERDFLIRYLHVPPSEILVIKTCLEENRDETGEYLPSELIRFNLEDRRVVLFLANMRAFMNRRSAYYIINELAAHFKSDEFGDIMFVLAGVGSEELLPSSPNVIATGTLSEESLYALVDRADVCIDPAVISGGIKTKVQFYLKRGKAVLTTPAGAEGINLYGQNDLAFLISPIEDFANTLKYALRNLGNLKKLAINNRQVYRKQFSWEVFLEQITLLMQRLSETSRIES